MERLDVANVFFYQLDMAGCCTAAPLILIPNKQCLLLNSSDCAFECLLHSWHCKHSKYSKIPKVHLKVPISHRFVISIDKCEVFWLPARVKEVTLIFFNQDLTRYKTTCSILPRRTIWILIVQLYTSEVSELTTFVLKIVRLQISEWSTRLHFAKCKYPNILIDIYNVMMCSIFVLC